MQNCILAPHPIRGLPHVTPVYEPDMKTANSKSRSMTITPSLTGHVLHYIVDGICDVPCTIDAYVLDMDCEPDHPYAWYVVLAPSMQSLPDFLFSVPSSMEGCPTRT
jgi:hypothetical protein